MIDPLRLRTLNALLDEALDLPPDRREAWLCAGGAQRQAFVPELRRMLARAAIETDTFMRQPAAAALEVWAQADARPDSAGDTIGPYRLLEPLGEGGMATVWRAERADGALAREVALKLPRLGITPGLARRMARERDLLAVLEHPYIARLYDAGVSEGGRPWLAMECVAGEPIDVHVNRHGLDPHEVLRLVLQVCDALAHAHARLIVHRDLKPANILVTAAGQVRLLDFGVGKMLQGEQSDAGMGPPLTQVIGGAMTPDYASPEQVAGRPVTVATDVYSLGVVLYELLCGQRPYRVGRKSAAALEEAILSADVPPASSRCADRVLARQLRGDLDAVLAKALAKDPARRYASVEALAADLRAHLDGLPLQAQRPDWRYRLGKFARRHRWPLAMASAVALSLLVGSAAALWQAHAARLEAHRADRARQFIAGLLVEAQPREGRGEGGALRTADLLVRAGERIELELAGDPALAAEIGILVGERLSALGEPERALPALRAAVDRARLSFGQRHPLTLKGRNLLASGLAVQYPDEARRQVESLVPDALAGLPQTAAEAVFALRSQSFMLAKDDQAEPSIRVLRQAADLSERHLGSDHVQTLVTLGLLSNTHGRFRQFDRQLAVASEAMQRAQAALGAARPNTTLTAVERWYGEALRRSDRPADALPVLRRVLQDQRQLDGAETPRVRNALHQLGLALAESGQLGEALEHLRQVVLLEQRHNGVFNEDRVNYRSSLIVVLGLARRGDEVHSVVQDLHALQREAENTAANRASNTAAAASAATGVPLARQILSTARSGRVMAYRGRFDDAEAELDGQLQAVDRLQQPEPGLRAELWHSLALVARLRGDHRLASDRAERGWADPATRQARPGVRAALAAERAAARLERGDLAAARALNQVSLALFAAAQVQVSPLSATAWITQARLELAAGRPAQALALLDPLVQAWADAHRDSDWHGQALHWRGVAQSQLGRQAQAQADRAAAARLLRRSPVPLLQQLARG